MTHASAMLDRYPGMLNVDTDVLASTIDALHDCVEACTADADADSSEHDITDLVKCIRLCLDCADVCAATATVITRQTAFDSNAVKPLLEACATMCRVSGDECERHANMHAHCRECAEVSRRCEQACRDLVGAIRSS